MQRFISHLICYVCVLNALSSCADQADSSHTSDMTSSVEVEAGALSRSEEERVWVELVVGSEWSITPPELDPYEPLREGRTRCGVTDMGEEYGGIEISTTRCGHMTLTQPILSDLQAGDLLEIVVWHSPLVSETPAQGLMSVDLEEVTLWSETLLIPNVARSWTLTLEVTESFARGASMFFHVQNHGTNAYTLLSVKRGR